jgi:hypothetical protein
MKQDLASSTTEDSLTSSYKNVNKHGDAVESVKCEADSNPLTDA